MGFLDRLLGRSRDERSDIPGMTGGSTPRGYEMPTSGYTPSPVPAAPPAPTHAPATNPAAASAGASAGAGRSPDDIAIDRYRYLLRTAPPEAVEQAHAEAFARLSPEQRQRVLAEVGSSVPEAERVTSTDPQAMARMATRAEMRNPGTLEKSFGGGRTGAPGFGSMVGSSLLGTIAGVVIGSAVANALFGPAFGDPGTPVAEDAAAGAEGADGGGADGGMGEDVGGADAGFADAGGADMGGAEAAGDGGLFGGLFGGGGDDGGGGLGDFFGGDGGFDF